MAISTRNLGALPNIPELEKISLSIAVLDAVMSPEWQYRYFSFDRRWGGGSEERMASARNGQGDEYFLVFGPMGAFMMGFDHESQMSPCQQKSRTVWPGVLDKVPKVFSAQLAEPAFSMGNTTFCVWRTTADLSWQRGDIEFPPGDDPDGSENLLWMLDGRPGTYAQFCKEYYERQVDIATVTSVYAHSPLTEGLVKVLNPEASWLEIAAECEKMGYSISSAESTA
jgi:hypothetical protein